MLNNLLEKSENTNNIHHYISRMVLFDKIIEGDPGNWREMINYDEFKNTVKILLEYIKKGEPEVFLRVNEYKDIPKFKIPNL